MCIGILHAQPGAVLAPAVPALNPMDPDGDGWISISGTAFSGPLDDQEFELPFIPFHTFGPEPVNDNQDSEACRFYELTGDETSGAKPGYFLFSDPDGVPDSGDEKVIFRLRVAGLASASSAFSILIDTDYKFGFNGPEADPNAVSGNPGFEREITLYTNTGSSGGVRTWNVDGKIAGTSSLYHGSTAAHHQVAQALNGDPACATPVFADFWIPFSALGTSSATQLRMVATGNDNVGASLGGDASDIGGVSGHLTNSDDEQFITLMGSHPPLDLELPANLAPAVSDAVVSVQENAQQGLAIHHVASVDPNGDLITYSIAAGNDDMAFSIDASSGVIQVSNATALDFETSPSYTLVVSVSDGRLYDNAIITIHIEDVNEPPVANSAEVLLAENPPAGIEVHTFQASDPDAQSVLKFSILSGNETGTFEIDENTGVISVSDPSLIDFELTPGFTLAVQVTDGSFFVDASVQVLISDINEAPSISGANFTIEENSIEGWELGGAAASDPDAGTVLSYSFSEGNRNDAFAIDPATGTIYVHNSQALDFETAPVFSLTVVASDGALTAENEVVIHLTDVNEAPQLDDATITLTVLLESGEVAYTVMATDPDAGDVLEYSIELGNGALLFSLDSRTGDLIVEDAVELFKDLRTLALTVVVRDRAGLEDRALLTVDIRRIPGRDDIVPLKGFSPDGNGTNDFWFIRGIRAFPNNSIRVFNRWGVNVFEGEGYDNERIVWRGEGRGAGEAESTYFFVIEIGGMQPITGYVIVKP